MTPPYSGHVTRSTCRACAASSTLNCRSQRPGCSVTSSLSSASPILSRPEGNPEGNLVRRLPSTRPDTTAGRYRPRREHCGVLAVPIAISRGGDRYRPEARLVGTPAQPLSLEHVADYQLHLQAARRQIDTYAMWGAANQIMDGLCSSDAFWYFQPRLIGQGEHWWQHAAQNPDNLADLPAVRALAGSSPRNR
ncbi:DUF4240 domain-containing protein [Micromonospora sp. NPDC050495]|uniref:DUF4240 domain-containing protein n=1 Tax=Micromonospora sp. NPDC050495 TaxID=3154936 RepID=UPI0033E2CABC